MTMTDMLQSKPVSFLSACRDFFGLLPGQSAMDFLKELKALSTTDRTEIIWGLEQNGYQIIKS